MNVRNFLAPLGPPPKAVLQVHFPAVCAYRTRLNARPSFARAIDEARPLPLTLFLPPGAPDCD
jgi:hypothetical protein